MKEYRPIPGYEKYGISTDGEVKNLKTGKIRKPCTKKNYLGVIIYDNNIKRTFRPLHKLLAIVYLDHIPCGYKIVVDHINAIRSDNRLENLQLITQRKNATKDRKGITSKYIGVNWHSRAKKWVARIQINGKTKHLGYFLSEEEASEAYQTALKNHLSQGGDI